MLPFRRTGYTRYFLLVSFLLAFLFEAGLLNAFGDDLAPTKQKLAALRGCLSGTESQIDQLAQGLTSGYSGSRWQSQDEHLWKSVLVPPPPKEYLASLDRDVAACNVAAKLPDAEARRNILDSVRRDVQIKADDCRQFGMGRMVTVHIVTLHDATTENGWEVFYKWRCLSGFDTSEVRMPGLTSPAVIELPPGEYNIRAEKKISATEIKKTGVVAVIFGLKPSIDVELPVL